MKGKSLLQEADILPVEFYQRSNVLQIAQQLIGKILCTRIDGIVTAGRIVETEAYAGIHDRASHAFGGRQTARVAPMYAHGGISYVYLCYGIHHLFNVVTNKADIPHAILIRALEPVWGIEAMRERLTVSNPGRSIAANDMTIARGPGKLSRALGIETRHTAMSLMGPEIQIMDDGFRQPARSVMRGPRIGVDYAGDDAALPYRFFVKDHPAVSGRSR